MSTIITAPSKAISIRQPWATLIALRHKRYETRGWETPHRGPIAIHASKDWRARSSWQFWLRRVFREALPEETWLRFTNRHSGAAQWKGPLGAVIAVANLVECQRAEAIRGHIDEREMIFGDFSEGRFGWALADVVALPEPVPCSGKLGMFALPDEVREAVGTQLGSIRAEMVRS